MTREKPSVYFATFFLFSMLLFPPGRAGAAQPAALRVKDGDIIFQISHSAQSKAIQIATQSKYSHCGIVFHKDGKPFVYEAVQTMTLTPIETWVRRGVGGHYLLMRLKNRDARLTPAVLENMRKAGRSLAPRSYDIFFQWSDDRIYCSELIWKIYKRGAGIELAAPRPFGEYTLDKPEVRKLIKKRYGDSFSLNEPAVAPSDLVESPLLETVVD